MSISKGRPPALNSTELVKLIRSFYAFDSIESSSVKKFPGYDDRNYYFRGVPSRPSSQNGHEFVLKMINELHSTHDVVIGISELWGHLRAKGFNCSSYLPNKEGNAVSFIPKSLCDPSDTESTSGQTYALHIMHFIPGELFDLMDKKYLTPKLLNEAGKFLGKIDSALKDGFNNAALDRRYIPDWDLQYLPTVRKHLPLIDDSSHRGTIETILDGFESFVVPKMPTLPKGIIHGDPNGMNLIVRKNGNKYELAGMIDYYDSVCSYYVFDIGMFLAYTMIENLEPAGYSNAVEFVGEILRGYVTVFPLSKEELSCLFYVVLGRCCQSAVMGEIGYKAEPWNTYFLKTPNKAYKMMDLLLGMGKEKVDAIWAKFISSQETE